jgi:hypothetical protein
MATEDDQNNAVSLVWEPDSRANVGRKRIILIEIEIPAKKRAITCWSYIA